VFRVDPTNQSAREFEQTIYAAAREHQRKQEEARRLQEEQRARVEELQRKLEDQARLRKRNAAAWRSASEDRGCLQKAREFVRDSAFDKALNEIETVYGFDPGHAEPRNSNGQSWKPSARKAS